jgi:hypothetical protein
MSNDTQTVTLTDFLLARFAEDEAEARRDLTAFVRQHGLAELTAWSGWGSAYRNPARVLAECEAKRQIVHNVAACIQDAEDGPGSECLRYTAQIVTPTLYALAAVYADHPDYREDWRP